MYTLDAPWRAVIGYWIVEPFRSTSDHVAARALHGLLDGQWHFARLAAAEADAAVAVANHGQRGEAEDTATLDHLGDAVDLDELLDQAFFVLFFCVCERHL